MNIQIAIDGPAGAGKSTIAKKIAKEFDILYLDTGALYRAIGYFSHTNKIKAEKAIENIIIDVKYENFEQRVIINDEDVTDKIRTAEMSIMASNVSKIPQVRQFLLSLQQDIGNTQSVVMDGRDIGTVILPKADVKIFLTASAECRAKRRFNEMQENITYQQVLDEVILRDKQDSQREIAPLKPAVDSIILDTSSLTLNQSIEKAIEIIKNKIN